MIGWKEERTYRVRRKLAWSQRKLAQFLGVSERTVIRWENGHTTPRDANGVVERLKELER